MPTINLPLANYSSFALSDARQKRINELDWKSLDWSSVSAVESARAEIVEMTWTDSLIDTLFRSGSKRAALEAIATIHLGVQAQMNSARSEDRNTTGIGETNCRLAQVKLITLLSPTGRAGMAVERHSQVGGHHFHSQVGGHHFTSKLDFTSRSAGGSQKTTKTVLSFKSTWPGLVGQNASTLACLALADGLSILSEGTHNEEALAGICELLLQISDEAQLKDGSDSDVTIVRRAAQSGSVNQLMTALAGSSLSSLLESLSGAQRSGLKNAVESETNAIRTLREKRMPLLNFELVVLAAV